MFREMRRKDKQLSAGEAIEILEKGEIGVLSTVGEDGYPYGVPLNYVYHNGSIYFHTAGTGHKLDNMKMTDKVSFCVTCDVEILREAFDTNYKSAVLFGRSSEAVEDEKDEALLELIKKYSGQFIEKGRAYIEKSKGSIKVYKIDVEHITGKAQV